MSDKPSQPPSGGKPAKPPPGGLSIKAPPAKPGAAPGGGQAAKKDPAKVKEIGGPEGPEPTRYGDWERKGRISDF